MRPIFEYFDYQKYLRDFYDEKKAENSDFSYRYIQMKTGIDPGYLLKVFQGKKHLTQRYVESFTLLCGLGRRESAYFEQMVKYGRAKKNADIKETFEKLLSFVEFSSKTIEAGKYEFYQKWYYTAVREVIGYGHFYGDCESLAKTVEPNITPSEARKAVALLEGLNFIRKTSSGRYEVTSRFVTTGEKWRGVAVRSFQDETMQLARRALESIPREERDISTITVSLSDRGFEKLSEAIKKARQEFLAIAHEDMGVNRTYQVNIQMFPISRKQKSDAGE